MEPSGHFTHGSDPEQLPLPVHRHSISFDDPAANVFALEAGGIQPQAQAQAHGPPQQARPQPRDMPADESAAFRRDSINSCALSPALTDPKWDDARRPSFAATNPFRNNDLTAAVPFRSSGPAAAPSALSSAMPQTAAGWHFDHASNTASPLDYQAYAGAGDDFDISELADQVGDVSTASPAARRISAPGTFNDSQAEGSMDGHTLQSPQSPTSNPDWMGMAANDAQSAAFPRHMRAGYRPSRPVPSRATSDGIRKKNARIDIPADRHLGNIDQLIESANDDDQVKELKAQRRLLRNREAALASRQRKKQHTEDLELKEQRYMKQINDLQRHNDELAVIHSKLDGECGILFQKYEEVCRALQAYEMEKQELIMKHTQETGRLRRQVQHLQEQLDNASLRDQMPGAPENLATFTSDMNALSVDPHSYGMMHLAPGHEGADMAAGYGPFAAPPQSGPAETVKPVKRDADPPIASGVLFMILLCGAFVASKANSRHIIPQMPEEVRVASTTVLDTLLRDGSADAFGANAGIQNMVPHHVAGAQATHDATWDRSTHHDGRQTLYRSLTMPTAHATADQIFDLSAAEYQGFTSPETYINQPSQSTPTPRRNLAETLAGLRHESISKATPAEVYSRSLLWDQIPVDVVRQFKELVRDSRNVEEMKHEFDETPMWPYAMGPQGYDPHNA